jgi:hypothetical protein
MKAALIALAIVSFFAGNALWAWGGFHRGWTKTSVAVEKTDEITGIAYKEYEDKFVPGVEFPFGGIVLAILLAATSLHVKGRPAQPEPAIPPAPPP